MKKILQVAFFFIIVLSLTDRIYSINQDESTITNDLNKEKKSRKMVDIGLSEKNREIIAKELNRLLANEYVLYTKTLKYHWNIKGKYFGPLHMLFQKQYEQLFEFIDKIAERSLALGFEADGTLSEFLKNSTLDEQTGKNPDEEKMIKYLLQDHEAIIKQLRDIVQLSGNLNDWGTNNFAADLIEQHEKTAWMLRAHLQK